MQKNLRQKDIAVSKRLINIECLIIFSHFKFLFQVLSTVKILYRIEKRRKKHLVAIPTLRSEKWFVQENDLQVKMAVVRN